MTFDQLVRVLEKYGFYVVKGKGFVRYYGKPGCSRLIRIERDGSKQLPVSTSLAALYPVAAHLGERGLNLVLGEDR